MAKVLLINPSYEPSYGGTKVGIINPIHPTLGLATIAATARESGEVGTAAPWVVSPARQAPRAKPS